MVASDFSFRYKACPFSVSETQSNFRINERLAPDTFSFKPSAGAEQVDDLGERTDEYHFAAPARR